MNSVVDAWQALRGEGRSEAGWHLRRLHPETSCHLFAGIHQPDDVVGLILEAEVTALAPSVRIPKSAGFIVETRLVGHSHSGRVRIVLSLSQKAYTSVFATLCSDAVDALVPHRDARAAVTAFIGRLHIWQAFMARHGDGLSEAGVVGLMGELVALRDYLAPLIGIERAVSAWAGPSGEPNDFCLAGGFLEIKATTRQAPNRLFISSADQLDIGRGRILLGHVRFREGQDGETLPEMVSAIRANLSIAAPAALLEFSAALLAAGYIDAHRDLYELRLARADFELLEVTAEFPHIAANELRNGVSDCTYSIDLAICGEWALPPSALADLAGGFSD